MNLFLTPITPPVIFQLKGIKKEIRDNDKNKIPKISFSLILLFMRETGFGPAQALSHRILSPARLTTPAPPQAFTHRLDLKKFLYY